jgi:hypothetical protein
MLPVRFHLTLTKRYSNLIGCIINEVGVYRLLFAVLVLL